MVDSNAAILGPALRDAVILAISRLEAAPALSNRWSEADAGTLRQETAHLLNRQADAASILASDAERLTSGIELVSFLELGGPFGPAWSGHPFASPAMGVGYKLREPDLTRELASLMGRSAGRRGSERAVSFLRILTELASETQVRETLTGGVRPNVVAEHEVRIVRRHRAGSPSALPRPTGRSSVPRIDMVFDWPAGADGRRAVVVIEAKLGAVVGDDQLKPYREEALRRAKGGPVALILLTAAADRVETRYRAWSGVRWLPLMRRWETELAAADDGDSEFARLRAHVWSFLLRFRKGYQ